MLIASMRTSLSEILSVDVLIHSAVYAVACCSLQCSLAVSVFLCQLHTLLLLSCVKYHCCCMNECLSSAHADLDSRYCQLAKHDQDQVMIITAQATVKYDSQHGSEDPQRSDVTIPDPESIW